MGSLKILIDGKALDLGDPSKINIANSYAIADINEIDARKDSNTKEIKVPATQLNRQIFGFPEDINSAESLNQRTSYSGSMEYDGVEIIRGLVKFLKPVISSTTEFYFTIVGQSGDWRDKIGNKTLLDLDLSDQEHVYTKENINIADYVQEGRIYSYPLIDNGALGRFEVYNVWNLANVTILLYRQRMPYDGQGNQVPYYNAMPPVIGQEIVITGFGLNEDIITTVQEQNNVNAGTEPSIGINPEIELHGTGYFYFRTGPKFVQVTDRTPAIQIKGLIDRVFNEAGYRIKSNFMLNQARKMFLFRAVENGSQFGEEYYEQYQFKAAITANQNINHTDTPDITTTAFYGSYSGLNPDGTLNQGGSTITRNYYIVKLNTTEYDNSQLFNIDQHYFSPLETGVYRFTYKGKITATPIGNFTLCLLIVDQYGGRQEVLLHRLENTTEPAYDFSIDATTAYLNINPGTKVYVAIRNNGSGINDFIIKADGTELTNEMYEKPFTYGSLVNLHRFLPDMQQIDLIRAIKQLFNLYFLTDVDRGIVYIEPRDQFYSNKIMDWTGKIDLSKEMEITELGTDIDKRHQFSYMRDAADVVVENQEKVTGIRLAAKEATIGNIFAEDNLTENENPVFCPTLMGVLSQPPAVNFTSTEVPKMRNGELKITFDTRILWYEGWADSLQPGESWIFENELRNNTFPRFYSLDKNNYSYKSLYFNSTAKNIGLFDKHYAGLFNELNGGRMLTAYLKLTPNDIQNFVNIDTLKKDYRARVLMNFKKEPGYYRINKIYDYDPTQNQTTKVDLVKETDRAALPVFPIFHLQMIELTATDTTAGDNTTVCLTVKNLGSVAGTFEGLVFFAGNYYEMVFDVGENETVTGCIEVPVPETLPSSTYIVKLQNFDAGYNEFWGEADFYVDGCDSPAMINFTNLNYSPINLQQGSTLTITEFYQNFGCYNFVGTLVISLYNGPENTLVDSRSFNLNVPGLSGILSSSAIFTNIPAGTLEYNGQTDYIMISASFGENGPNQSVYLHVPVTNPLAGPHIVTKSPADNSTGVNASGNIVITYNQQVVIGTGNLLIKKISDGSVVASYPISSFAGSGTTTITRAYSGLLENTAYYIELPTGFVINLTGQNSVAATGPEFWNFNTGAFLSVTVPNVNIVRGWTMKTGADGAAFSTVRNAASADTFSGSTSPPIQLTMQKQNTNFILRHGHAFFKTQDVLPTGATIQQAVLVITRTLSSNIDAEVRVEKSTTNTLNAAAYSATSGTSYGILGADISGNTEFIIPLADVNLSGWTNFFMRFKADFDNTPDIVPSGQQLFFYGTANLILKYTI